MLGARINTRINSIFPVDTEISPALLAASDTFQWRGVGQARINARDGRIAGPEYEDPFASFLGSHKAQLWT